MALESELGTFLRSARERGSLALRAVEQSTGISNAYLSQLESGKIKQPSPKTLHALAELYGVSYSEAMQFAGYPVPGGREAKSSGPLARFGSISSSEEKALAEYLEFLRRKRRKA